MKNLVKKEFVLSMHPTVLLFLALSAMLIIPNYPYYVTFFYTSLAIYFTCLGGRENNDIFFTLSLPVAKRSVVGARFAFVILAQLAQLLVAVPFAVLRQRMPLPGNQVGMDANIALFGLSLIMLGLFNWVFFSIYYKDVYKVGKAFIVASVVEFLYICVAEVCAHVLPLFRDKLDTADPQFLGEKLTVLAAGACIYIVLTACTYRRSVKRFEQQDI